MMRSAARRFLSTSRKMLDKPTLASTKDVLPFEKQVPGFRAPGVIATDYELSTGAERYEYLEKLAGRDPWADLNPIVLTAPGTTKNPIVVTGHDVERYIGCTGFPADSHEPVYLTIRPHKHGHMDKCPHCGNVFKYVRSE